MLILLKEKIRYALIFTGIAFTGFGVATIIGAGKEPHTSNRYGSQQRTLTLVIRNSPKIIPLSFIAAGLVSFSIVYLMKEKNTFRR